MFKHSQRLITATGSAILLAHMAVVTAQTPPPKPERGEHMRAQWQQADLDKDGQLSKAEAQAAGMKHLVDNFEAMDANKDSKISEAEMRTWMQGKHAGHGAPQGQPPAGSPPPQGAARPPEKDKDGMGFKSPDQRRAQMQERFNKADTNKDGGLSKAELQAAGMQRVLDNFDAIDANKDGKVTLEEMRAAWERRQ
jgi:Ca2+-binding EF-hand superfamily protein